jgi:hypothetical protein
MQIMRCVQNSQWRINYLEVKMVDSGKYATILFVAGLIMTPMAASELSARWKTEVTQTPAHLAPLQTQVDALSSFDRVCRAVDGITKTVGARRTVCIARGHVVGEFRWPSVTR